MTYEFHGADLETVEGQEALLAVLPYTFDNENQSPLIEEIGDKNDNFSGLAKTNLDAFKALTEKAINHDDPRARYLAGQLALASATIDPDFTTEVLVNVLTDESPLTRDSAGWVTDMLSHHSEVWDEEFDSFGLMRLAKIAKAYRETK